MCAVCAMWNEPTPKTKIDAKLRNKKTNNKSSNFTSKNGKNSIYTSNFGFRHETILTIPNIEPLAPTTNKSSIGIADLNINNSIMLAYNTPICIMELETPIITNSAIYLYLPNRSSIINPKEDNTRLFNDRWRTLLCVTILRICEYVLYGFCGLSIKLLNNEDSNIDCADINRKIFCPKNINHRNAIIYPVTVFVNKYHIFCRIFLL